MNFLRQRTAAHIAMQIRALREDRDWSQTELAKRSGIAQPAISRCERVGYGKQTISTLLRLAEAFDVGLDVSFVAYSELWRRERRFASDPLAPPSFPVERAAAVEKGRRLPKNVFDITTGKRFRLPPASTRGPVEKIASTPATTQLTFFEERPEEVTSANYNIG